MSEIVKYSGCVFHFNLIGEYRKKEIKCSLFSHPIYYLQNSYNPIKDSVSNKVNELVDKNRAKALLLLSTFPFAFNKAKTFFNSKNSKNGGYEMVPYGFLLLCGGLLLRKQYMLENNGDLIKVTDDKGNKLYKQATADETYFVKFGNEYHFCLLQPNSTQKYVKFSELYNDTMPLYTKNFLIAMFQSFVTETLPFLSSMELYLSSQKSKEYRPLSYCDMMDIISQFNNKKYKGNYNFLLPLCGANSIELKNPNNLTEKTRCVISNFENHYCFGFMRDNMLNLVYKEDDSTLQLLLDKLFNHRCGVVSNVSPNRDSNFVSLSKQNYDALVKGFCTALRSITDDYRTEKNRCNDAQNLVGTNGVSDDDIKKSIYLYFKQFWDKWLCGIYNRYHNELEKGDYHKADMLKNTFRAKWFESQFLFIDSFYVDISDKLKLNLNTVKELIESSRSTETLFGVHVHNHLANVAERHYCGYFCYPDFINFEKKNANGETMNGYEIIADLFNPRPYNQLNRVEVENQFVVMRTNGAQINNQNYQFTNDSFDIWTSTNGGDIRPALSTFNDNTLRFNDDDKRKRIGYKIPSFGVAFSKQQNSIFKAIDVGMDTQQITEQSIRSLCYISQLGNSNRRAITFYGNDIYSVYSGYSYIVTITMLGDAQIQPLMYFQLMNIPMFRGTYMIIEVKHSIKPGDFTTIFRGMKLSKIEAPINSSWFTITPPESDGDDDDDDNNNGCGDIEVVNSNGSPINIGSSTSDGEDGMADVYKYSFRPSQIHFATSTCDVKDDLYFNNTNRTKPTNLLPENKKSTGIKLVTFGPTMKTSSNDGISGYIVVNGRLMGNYAQDRPGFVLYKNDTYDFVTSEEFQYLVTNNLSNIKYAAQNWFWAKDGSPVLPYKKADKFKFKCLAEISGRTDKLYFIVSKDNVSASSFKRRLEQLKVTRALYLDTNEISCGYWMEEPKKSDGKDGDRAIRESDILYWNGKKEYWAKNSSVMYIK